MLPWIIGIAIAVVVAIILGIIAAIVYKKIDKKMDAKQHEAIKLSRLFAQYNCDFLAEFFENLGVDDYEAAIKQINQMMASPKTLELFVTQIAKPLAEGYAANPSILHKVDG